MVNFEAMKKAARIVEKIIYDMSDRDALGGEWERLDEDTQTEIRATWKKFVYQEIVK